MALEMKTSPSASRPKRVKLADWISAEIRPQRCRRQSPTALAPLHIPSAVESSPKLMNSRTAGCADGECGSNRNRLKKGITASEPVPVTSRSAAAKAKTATRR